MSSEVILEVNIHNMVAMFFQIKDMVANKQISDIQAISLITNLTEGSCVDVMLDCLVDDWTLKMQT